MCDKKKFHVVLCPSHQILATPATPLPAQQTLPTSRQTRIGRAQRTCQLQHMMAMHLADDTTETSSEINGQFTPTAEWRALSTGVGVNVVIDFNEFDLCAQCCRHARIRAYSVNGPYSLKVRSHRTPHRIQCEHSQLVQRVRLAAVPRHAVIEHVQYIR